MRNNSLDTLKFICAILVVFIHTPQPKTFQAIIDPVLRCAVPVFFMISGYFTWGGDLCNKIPKRLIYILKIFCYGVSVYGLVFIMHSRSWDFIYLLIDNFKSLLLYNNVYGQFGEHLWYIHAYIYTLIIMWFIHKYNLYKYLFYITPLLVIAGLFIGKYYEIFTGYMLPTIISRNFLFMGVPFFAIGLYIKKEEAKIKAAISKNVALAGFVLCYLIGLFESLYLGLSDNQGDLYITTAFASILLLIYCLQMVQTEENVFSKMGRNDSLYIYIFHILFLDEIGTISMKLSLEAYWPYASAVAVIFATIVFIKILRKVGIIGRLI